jgi:hypothetical protein
MNKAADDIFHTIIDSYGDHQHQDGFGFDASEGGIGRSQVG